MVANITNHYRGRRSVSIFEIGKITQYVTIQFELPALKSMLPSLTRCLSKLYNYTVIMFKFYVPDTFTKQLEIASRINEIYLAFAKLYQFYQSRSLIL